MLPGILLGRSRAVGHNRHGSSSPKHTTRAQHRSGPEGWGFLVFFFFVKAREMTGCSRDGCVNKGSRAGWRVWTAPSHVLCACPRERLQGGTQGGDSGRHWRRWARRWGEALREGMGGMMAPAVWAGDLSSEPRPPVTAASSPGPATAKLPVAVVSELSLAQRRYNGLDLPRTKIATASPRCSVMQQLMLTPSNARLLLSSIHDLDYAIAHSIPSVNWPCSPRHQISQ